MDILELRRKRAELIDELRKLNDSFGDAQLDETQQAAYDALKAQIEALKTQIDRQEEIDRLTIDLRSQPGTQPAPQPQPQAPVVLRYAGDDRKQAELRAVRLYVRGDEGAIREIADVRNRLHARIANDVRQGGAKALRTGGRQRLSEWCAEQMHEWRQAGDAMLSPLRAVQPTELNVNEWVATACQLAVKELIDEQRN
jgi:HK97 family phage major capsid protein